MNDFVFIIGTPSDILKNRIEEFCRQNKIFPDIVESSKGLDKIRGRFQDHQISENTRMVFLGDFGANGHGPFLQLLRELRTGRNASGQLVKWNGITYVGSLDDLSTIDVKDITGTLIRRQIPEEQPLTKESFEVDFKLLEHLAHLKTEAGPLGDAIMASAASMFDWRIDHQGIEQHISLPTTYQESIDPGEIIRRPLAKFVQAEEARMQALGGALDPAFAAAWPKFENLRRLADNDYTVANTRQATVIAEHLVLNATKGIDAFRKYVQSIPEELRANYLNSQIVQQNGTPSTLLNHLVSLKNQELVDFAIKSGAKITPEGKKVSTP